MVGHTGVDPGRRRRRSRRSTRASGEVVEAVHETGGACIITADHGNADHMLEPDGSPNTAHSLNPVPVIVTVAGAQLGRRGHPRRRHADACWSCSACEQPAEMTGRSLVLARRLVEPALFLADIRVAALLAREARLRRGAVGLVLAEGSGASGGPARR